MKHAKYTSAAALLLLSFAGVKAASAQYGVIYDFSPNHGDPIHPTGTLRTGIHAEDPAKFFGATTTGSPFTLERSKHGGWTETTSKDAPGGSNWIADGHGHFFTTNSGTTSVPNGWIIEASRDEHGPWTQKVIHTFVGSPTDGSGPYGNLVFDTHGNLYGTTIGGGTGGGTAFELTPDAHGNWSEKIIYTFGASTEDATEPEGLIIDANSNLYGTSQSGGPLYYNDPSFGGAEQGGTVFELSPKGNGAWTEQIIHAFIPSTYNEFGYSSIPGDGWSPSAGLVLDNHGNLYGTTLNGITVEQGGGPGDTIEAGTIFKLFPGLNGWTEQDYLLNCDQQVFCYSNHGLALDSLGNLYGTTSNGGSELGNDDGNGDTVFKLTPSFAQTTLYNLPTVQTDGHPSGGVTLADGSLFGLTSDGGPDGNGTAYEIQGVTNPTPIATTTALKITPSSDLAEGDPVTLTATVTPATGLLIPTGTVRFEDSTGRCIREAHVTELLVAGKAVYTGTIPRERAYSVTVHYTGGPGFAPSESPTQIVSP